MYLGCRQAEKEDFLLPLHNRYYIPASPNCSIDRSYLKASKTIKMAEYFKDRLTELLQQDWSFHWDRWCRCRWVLKYNPGAGSVVHTSPN